MGSCAAPSAKGMISIISTEYLQLMSGDYVWRTNLKLGQENTVRYAQ
jgi:hypothetical protein